MSKKYYIRISEDEPLPDEQGLSFEVTIHDEDTQWLLISENQYNNLLESLEGAVENFQNSNILEQTINNKVESMDLVIPLATNATYIKHPERNTKYSYAQLVDSFNTIDTQISQLETSKANVGDVSYLSSRVNDISSTLNSHNHDDKYYKKSEVDEKQGFHFIESFVVGSGSVVVFASESLVYVVLSGKFTTNADATTTLSRKITKAYAPMSTVTTWANINSGFGKVAINDDGSIQLYSATNALNVHTSVVYINVSNGIG